MKISTIYYKGSVYCTALLIEHSLESSFFFQQNCSQKYRLKPGHITDILCFDSVLQFYFFLDYITDHEKNLNGIYKSEAHP